MTSRWARAAVRWLAAIVVVAVLATSAITDADAAGNATKIDPALLAQAKANPDQEFSVIVRATPKERAAPKPASNGDRQAVRAKSAIERANGRVGHGLSIVGGASAKLRGAAVLALSHDSDVSYISSDYVLRAKFDPVAGAPLAATPGIVETNAPAAWTQYGVTGKGIGVAIVDSGIAAHPDLAGRIVASVDFTSGVPGAVVAGPADPGGHGTHVAGLVGGDGTASGGAFTGTAPGADLLDVRVIGATGSTDVSTVLRGLQWVVANRATYNIRVVNLSLGATVSTSYAQDPLATAVEVLTFANIAVVVSAGNSGPNDSTITTPAFDPFVITVGAVDDSGTQAPDDDLVPAWSSRGATAFDGIAKPDLVAPGRKMVSLRSAGSTLDQLYPERQVAGIDPLAPAYFRLSGTSMSAPVVAGIVALMLERDPRLTPAQVKHRLRTTATPLAFGTPTSTGAGMVNALAAVAAADPAADLSTYRVSDGFATQMRTYITGQPIVWRDPLYNGGVDSMGRPWAAITWDTAVWDPITWQNIAWESFTWTGIAWEGMAWEGIAWETTTLAVGTLSGAGTGWVLVD
ncbi:MAG TPA: S8 family peptidase [Candidatus Limnocylindria bacterium]